MKSCSPGLVWWLHSFNILFVRLFDITVSSGLIKQQVLTVNVRCVKQASVWTGGTFLRLCSLSGVRSTSYCSICTAQQSTSLYVSRRDRKKSSEKNCEKLKKKNSIISNWTHLTSLLLISVVLKVGGAGLLQGWCSKDKYIWFPVFSSGNHMLVHIRDLFFKACHKTHF